MNVSQQIIIPKIPTLIFAMESMDPSSSVWATTCKKVTKALEEYGFFIVQYENGKTYKEAMNMSDVFDVMEKLFELPLKTKAKNTSDDLVFYAYVGQLSHAPLHESMGIPEATTCESVERFTHLMWPTGNKRFSDTILSYARMVSELEQLVDKMVFESYGAGKHYESHVRSTTYLLRTIKYSPPSTQDDGRSASNVGTNVHTDKGFLAILHQNQVNGLQIQLRNGEWLALDVPPASFVVMAGDAYQAWSNGRIFAARHQVIMKGDKPRYCLALFSFNHGITEIPEELVDLEHPLQFKPFDNFGLARFYLSGKTEMTESTAKAYCGLHA